MMPTNSVERSKNRGALFIIAPLVIALVVACIAYDPFHLIGTGTSPGGTGFTKLPVWLWFIGAGVLGLSLAYGISQNRRRPRAEVQMTERATADLYRQEEEKRRQEQQPWTGKKWGPGFNPRPYKSEGVHPPSAYSVSNKTLASGEKFRLRRLEANL
jgi:hypothetical protein